MEQILNSIPEVENSSRRTGLELGLAAVTEANRGDILVKLKKDRSRAIDDVIEDVRAKVAAQEPAVRVEFVQVLQDMIGDLTSAPEPVEIKLFSQDPALLETWAPKVASAIGKVNGVVDVLDGIENTISGPAVVFQINPSTAARAGFTPEEVAVDAAAILEGEPAVTPVVNNDRAYVVRVRFPDSNRISLETMSDTLLTSSSGKTATLGALATVTELPPQIEIRRENLQRDVAVTARLEGTDLGSGVAAVQKAVDGLHMPSSIRVEYGGTYKEEQKSFRDLVFVFVLAIILVFIVLLFEFRIIRRAPGNSGVGAALDFGRFFGPDHHSHHIQRGFIHGNDHGGGHRRQERNFAAGCGPEISATRALSRGRHAASQPSTFASDRNDGTCHHRGHAALSFCTGRRLTNAAAPCHCCNRRNPGLNGVVADHHSSGSLLSGTGGTIKAVSTRTAMKVHNFAHLSSKERRTSAF